MVNFMQSNQHIGSLKKEYIFNIINNTVWENIIQKIENNESLELVNKYIHEISIKYNIDKKNLIKDFFNYIIRHKLDIVNKEFLNCVENLIHTTDCNNKTYVNYSVSKLAKILCKNKIK